MTTTVSSITPGKRQPGEGITIEPDNDTRITVGPVTVKEGGVEQFWVTIEPVYSPGGYL